MSWGEDAALELDALQATYGDDLHINESDALVSMMLAPSNTEPDAYVQCKLALTIHQQYPEAAPHIAIQEAKGIGSSRLAAFQHHLQQEAAHLQGEMMLGQLFECAKEWLVENNWPEGPCIFCLEELAPCAKTSSNSSSSIDGHSAAQPYMRLPCFHAYHQSCFTDWWCWQQQALTEQQQQLEQRAGATAAASLVQEQLPSKEGEHFQLTCPSCRAAFSMQQDLQHMVPQLQQQMLRLKQSKQVAVHHDDSSCSSGSGRLSAAELAPWREVQQRHAALFAAQQQRNGIITSTNISISDWDPAAVAASQAASSAADTARAQSSASIIHADSQTESSGATTYSRGGRGSSRGGRCGSSRGRGRGRHEQHSAAAGCLVDSRSATSSSSRGRGRACSDTAAFSRGRGRGGKDRQQVGNSVDSVSSRAGLNRDRGADSRHSRSATGSGKASRQQQQHEPVSAPASR